jgi:DNA gyrase subunit B
MLSSDAIRLLITALGMGIGKEDKDLAKLRYHTLIIMTDADVDGSHIRTLLLTFFYRQFPELIEGGHVLIAQPPLYKVGKGKKERYLKDEAALESHLIQLGSEQTQVVGTEAAVPIAGEALANVLKQYSQLDRILDVVERGRRNRDVVTYAAREDRLGPEAFRDVRLLEQIAGRLRLALEQREDLRPISAEIREPEAGELPVIDVAVHAGIPGRESHTELSLDFCSSPEFEEARRLAVDLTGAGRPPFAVISGSERIEMPSLHAAVRYVISNARKGLEIQRQRPGEPESSETTMNPEHAAPRGAPGSRGGPHLRPRRRHTVEEPRRSFIEAHARTVELDIWQSPVARSFELEP